MTRPRADPQGGQRGHGNRCRGDSARGHPHASVAVVRQSRALLQRDHQGHRGDDGPRGQGPAAVPSRRGHRFREDLGVHGDHRCQVAGHRWQHPRAADRRPGWENQAPWSRPTAHIRFACTPATNGRPIIRGGSWLRWRAARPACRRCSWAACWGPSTRLPGRTYENTTAIGRGIADSAWTAADKLKPVQAKENVLRMAVREKVALGPGDDVPARAVPATADGAPPQRDRALAGPARRRTSRRVSNNTSSDSASGSRSSRARWPAICLPGRPSATASPLCG